MKPIHALLSMFILLTLLKAFSLIVEERAEMPLGSERVAVLSDVNRIEEMRFGEKRIALNGVALNSIVAVAPPPLAGIVPTELTANWVSGVASLQDFYNPLTGEWRKVNGLGQMYQFKSNGHYVYAAFLRLQTGLCISEVSTYREGKVKATSDTITLTPEIAKTRTVIQCGSNSESVTDGPFEPVTMNYDVTANEAGQHQLLLTAEGTNMTLTREESAENAQASPSEL